MSEDESDVFLFPYPTQDRNAQPGKILSIQALNIPTKYSMDRFKMQKQILKFSVFLHSELNSILALCLSLV